MSIYVLIFFSYKSVYIWLCVDFALSFEFSPSWIQISIEIVDLRAQPHFVASFIHSDRLPPKIQIFPEIPQEEGI